MGNKPDMLRKYLKIVGIASIVFGLIFFLSTLNAISGAHDRLYYFNEADEKLSEQILFFLFAIKDHGLAMFNALTLGGICLYLAHRLSELNK